MSEAKRNQVFISYANENLETVKCVVNGLKKRNLNIWFDKEHLAPGRWKRQIIREIARSRYFIICISEAALRKIGAEPGFQDDELQAAYEIAQNQPEKEFTIVPVRLEECARGDFRISSFQQYDLFKTFEKSIDKLAVDLGGVALSEPTTKDQRTDDEKFIGSLMTKATAAYYARNLELTSTLADAVLKLMPENATAWVVKGIILDKFGYYGDALVAFDEALKLRSNYFLAWHHKGVVFMNLGQYENALEAFKKALDLEPTFAEALFSMGDAYHKLKREREAIIAYKKAILMDPDY